ncbi:MAG TPA: hypothetical protein VE869_13940 [Gemmatimonas sp.]|nr:hypothetical protein [Gemmatimonas sp.]
MRRLLCFLSLVLTAVSCGEPATGPYYAPKALAPDGLPVSLLITPATDSATDTTTITASGDSVIATAVLRSSGCSDYRAVAGQANGVLVITLIETSSDRICILISPPAVFRSVVRPIPPGEYRVEYRTRIVPPHQSARERIVGRQQLRLP